MKWGLVIVSRAKRQLRRLSADEQARIAVVLFEISEDPFRGDAKYLQGTDALRRRVGDWRILYELNETKRVIIVTAIKRRGSNTY
jgi:mRNA interferase RelE/StbE